MTYVDEDHLASVFNDVMTACTMYGGDPGGPYFDNVDETRDVIKPRLSSVFSKYELRLSPDQFFILVKKEEV